MAIILLLILVCVGLLMWALAEYIAVIALALVTGVEVWAITILLLDVLSPGFRMRVHLGLSHEAECIWILIFGALFTVVVFKGEMLPIYIGAPTGFVIALICIRKTYRSYAKRHENAFK